MLLNTVFTSTKYRRKACGLVVLLLICLGVNLCTNFELMKFSEKLGDFWNKKHHTHALLDALLVFVVWLRFRYLLNDPIDKFCGKHFGQLWRKAVSENLVQRWQTKKDKTRFLDAGQLIQEKVFECTRFLEDIGFSALRSFILLCMYVPLLWNVSPVVKIQSPWVFHINGILMILVTVCCIVGGTISFKIGKPLIEMDKHNQAKERELRDLLDKITYGTEDFDKGRTRASFDAVYASYSKMWLRATPVDTWNSFYGNGMYLLPIWVAGGWYVDGLITFGGLMKTFFLFGEVNASLSLFTNNLGRILNFLATYGRIKTFSDRLDEAEIGLNNRSDNIVNISIAKSTKKR